MKRLRRRHIGNNAFSQLSAAVTLLLVGTVILLFFGTRIFDWYWMAALAVAGAVLGAWRFRRRMLGDYALAQLADRKLALSDSLSTAWFFTRPTGRGSPEMRAAQRALADTELRSADPATVIRLSFPKGFYATGALAVLAFAMVAIRYGSYQRLALRAPVAPGVASLLRKLETPQLLAQTKKPADARHREESWEESGIALDAKDSSRAEGDSRSPAEAGERDARSSAGVKSGDPKDSISVEKIPQQGQGSEDASGEQGSEAGDQANAGDHTQGNRQTGTPGERKQSNATGRQTAAAQSNQPGANSNLMSKMRDAMSNLLSKLNGHSQQASRQQSDPGQKGSQQAAAQQNNPSSAQQQAGGRGSAQMEADNQGGTPQQAQAGNGQRSPQPGANRPGSADLNSGAGHQDGGKDLAAAQQLAAMGKISEILGRRSRDITGDITVEVNSGHQQLQTAYSEKNAGHMEASGEIHRDEVPLVLQAYVQQYFEQIRKSPSHPKQR